MRLQDIRVAGIYFDGKSGVREVVSLDAHEGTLVYKILAAKVEFEQDHVPGTMRSCIGGTSRCDAVSLAKWAKEEVLPAQLPALLARLAARKLRLTPTEKTFLGNLDVTKLGGVNPLVNGQLALVRRLVTKGVIERAAQPGGDWALTGVGKAWLQEQGPSAR